MSFEETIYAPATSPVNSTLAIIRISGPDTFGVVSSVFSRPQSIQPRMAVYGSIIDKTHILDDVVLIYYIKPSSFSGEDMAEIFCHGNPLILRRILNLLHDHGLRMAEPGEFSRRAFLNGKIDLTEAEAINQVILARSEWQIDSAIEQMHGSLKNAIGSLRDELIILKADIEASIDFTEEDIQFVSGEESLEKTKFISERLRDLLVRCETGEKYSRGIDVILAGRPNVGKSSIMNFLLNEERSIVSDLPGTTRDMIREEILVDGMILNLFDTAGIGAPDNDIERIGIERTHKKIRTSSLVFMILDATAGITTEDRQIIDEIADRKHLFVINKSDLADASQIENIKKILGKKSIAVSALHGNGMAELRGELSSILKNEFFDYSGSIVTGLRIIQLLQQALDSSEQTEKLMQAGQPAEIIAFIMQSLLDSLKEITGEITPDNILESIFSRFCIGK